MSRRRPVKQAGAAAAAAATTVAEAAGTAALEAATTGGKPAEAAKTAAVQAGIQEGFRLLSLVLAKVGRWRAGLPWQPGQERLVDLDALTPPQRQSLLADPGFEVKPAPEPAPEPEPAPRPEPAPEPQGDSTSS